MYNIFWAPAASLLESQQGDQCGVPGPPRQPVQERAGRGHQGGL